MADLDDKSTFESLVDQCVPFIARRLGLEEREARTMALAYVLGATDHALIRIQSQTVGPTALSADRVQLVESIAGRLGRVPTTRELTALLRVPESTAKSLLKNVLATSDRAAELALKSAFVSAQGGGHVGRGGKPPGGKKWVFPNLPDLEAARTQLEDRGVRYSTLSEKDGDYVLVVDKAFDPDAL